MPEGPEVKRQVDYLSKYQNKILTNITINSGRYKKHKPFDNYQRLVDSLPLKIKEINCKGKFIYIIFENQMVLFNTLGMTGYWSNKSNVKHNNLTFLFDKLKTPLYFNDYRNFGTFKYQNLDELNKKLNQLGPDILQDYNNFEEFEKRVNKKRNSPEIGKVLLDQKIVSGCGNYLRAEVLYHAKISPYRGTDDLQTKELKLIWNYLTKIGWIFYDYQKAINKKIIKKNDKLIKIYIDFDTYNDSYYHHNFLIYNNQTDPYNNTVIKELLGNRMIHYVPLVQG